MHNSQNSVQSKATFTSTVLAQAKLLAISTPSIEPKSSNIQTVSSAVAEKTEQQNASDISGVPTFHKPTVTLPEVKEEMRATLSRLSAEACQRAIISESAQGILVKADSYSIDYKYGIQYTDKFIELKDKVEQWETLLTEAIDWCIHWDKSEYDPITLQQEIEEAQHSSYLENSKMSSYFNSALGVEA